MIAVWLGAAWAADRLPVDVDRYPLVADVVLDGPARVHVPMAMRSLADPGDGTDLVLVDGEGRAVPFARLQGTPGGTRGVIFQTAATTDPTRFVITPTGRADRLLVTLPDGVPAATVTVTPRGGEALPSVLVWRFDGASQDRVDLPSLREPFEVRVAPNTPGQLAIRAPTFGLVQLEGPSVPKESLRVDLGPPVVQENGYARYRATVEQPAPWTRAVVLTSEPQLERSAGVDYRPWHDPDAFGVVSEAWPSQPTPIRRRTLRDGEVAEVLGLPVGGTLTDELALFVDTEGRPVPEMDGLLLTAEGVQLVVLEPGPGPHRLYAGAPEGTSPRWDLGTAWELGRGVDDVVEVGTPSANPEYVPPEIRAHLVEAGPTVDPTPFHYRREITGHGLSRITLPFEVVARARPDLGDLRVVAGGHQLPYTVRPGRKELPLAVSFDREELDGRTELRVHLPEHNLPVVWLTLTTPAELFERQVTVSRPGPQGPVPVRSLVWRGDGRGERISIQVPGPVDDELLITIRDGDNPPLPVDAVTAVTTTREIVTWLPPEGAEAATVELWYGAGSARTPSYDLHRLPPSEVVRRAVGTAELGPEQVMRPVVLSTFDRVLLGGGLAVFAAGLLALLVEALRRLPPAPTAPEDEGTTESPA
ncbi:MAG: hypothetical protein H6735_14635 [Alphaproteobacteria bacterium]|nr:hypothetical protein [Alphaproteobacteria bacterium]